jgi:hypothetical protein
VFDLARLLFVDKTGTSTNLLKLRGRVIRGEGPVDSVLHGRWKTITLLAGLRRDAIVAPFVIDGPLDGKIFRTDVERCLPRSSTVTSFSWITLQLTNSPACRRRSRPRTQWQLICLRNLRTSTRSNKSSASSRYFREGCVAVER